MVKLTQAEIASMIHRKEERRKRMEQEQVFGHQQKDRQQKDRFLGKVLSW